MDAHVEKRLAKERRRIEREVKAKGSTEEATAPGADETAKRLERLEQELAAERRERGFAEKTAGLQLDAKQRALLRNAWDPENPEKFDEFVTVFGIGKAPAPARTQSESNYRDPGGAAGPPDGELENDATRWDRDQIARWQADGTFKDRLEKFRNSLPGGGAGLFRKKIPKVG